MPNITIKGHDYNISLTRDSFARRATQYTNSIYEKFRKIGLTKDDVDINEERMAIKRAPATIYWWIDNHQCNFSYNKQTKFVDNLLVVSKVIENHINMVLNEEITIDEFTEIFKEHGNIAEQRANARDYFGLDEDHIDLDMVNKKYKLLAKDMHPDMPNGDIDKFKELNSHHKTLKRELE